MPDNMIKISTKPQVFLDSRLLGIIDIYLCSPAIVLAIIY